MKKLVKSIVVAVLLWIGMLVGAQIIPDWVAYLALIGAILAI